MARLLTDEPNELRFYDNISNSEIVFYYKTPTSQEIASYMNGMTKRVRNKLVNRFGENRLEHGLKILTGFREGDFIVPKNGKNVPISSNPQSPNYDPDWRLMLQKYASDLVSQVAQHAFEDTATTDMENNMQAAESESDAGEITDPNSF